MADVKAARRAVRNVNTNSNSNASNASNEENSHVVESKSTVGSGSVSFSSTTITQQPTSSSATSALNSTANAILSSASTGLARLGGTALELASRNEVFSAAVSKFRNSPPILESPYTFRAAQLYSSLMGTDLRPLQPPVQIDAILAADIARRCAPRSSDSAGATIAVSPPLLAVRIMNLNGPVARDPRILHPIVRCHILDATTGRYIRMLEPQGGRNESSGLNEQQPKSTSTNTIPVCILSTGPCINRTLHLDADLLENTLKTLSKKARSKSEAKVVYHAAQSDWAASHDASLLWGETLVFPITLSEAVQPNVIIAFEVLEPDIQSRISSILPKDEDGFYRKSWGFVRPIRADGTLNVDIDARVPLGMPEEAFPKAKHQPPGTVLSQSHLGLIEIAQHDFSTVSFSERLLHTSSLPAMQPGQDSDNQANNITSLPSPPIALQLRVADRKTVHSSLLVSLFGCIVPSTRFLTPQADGAITYAFEPPSLKAGGLPITPQAPLRLSSREVNQHPLLGRPPMALKLPTDVIVPLESAQGKAAVRATDEAARVAAAAEKSEMDLKSNANGDEISISTTNAPLLPIARRTTTDEPSASPSSIVTVLPTARLGVTCVSFSPDGRILAAACVGSSESVSYPIRLFEMLRGTELQSKDSKDINGDFLPVNFDGVHGNIVYMISWSADGQWLVSASGDGTCVVWHVPRAGPSWYRLKSPARPFSRLTHNPPGYVYCARFHPIGNSRVVITGSYDHGIRLWDTRTNETSLNGLRSSNSSSRITTLNKTSSSSSSSSSSSMIIIEGKLLGYLGVIPEGAPSMSSLSNDGGTLLLSETITTSRKLANIGKPPLPSGAPPPIPLGQSSVSLFSASRGRHDSFVNCIEFDTSASGKNALPHLLVTCDGAGVALIWELLGRESHIASDPNSYVLLRSIALPILKGSSIVSALFRPLHGVSVQLLLCGHGDLVCLVDVSTGKLIRTYGDASCKNSRLEASFSPDGDIIAAGSDDGILRLWDTTTGMIIPAVTQTADGRAVSLGFNGTLTSVCWSPTTHALAIAAFGSEYPIMILS
jgi:WD40 repeat protein